MLNAFLVEYVKLGRRCDISLGKKEQKAFAHYTILIGILHGQSHTVQTNYRSEKSAR